MVRLFWSILSFRVPVVSKVFLELKARLTEEDSPLSIDAVVSSRFEGFFYRDADKINLNNLIYPDEVSILVDVLYKAVYLLDEILPHM